LLPREITDLDARLESLRRSELIEPDTGWFLGEPALRFHHGLTRDAAYRRVLKGTRPSARSPRRLDRGARGGDRADETLGWHLSRPQHLREPARSTRRPPSASVRRAPAAAGRGRWRATILPAANLLGRALDRLDAADPARADLAIDWCEALLSAGDVAGRRRDRRARPFR
jgi:hypothetical protein